MNQISIIDANGVSHKTPFLRGSKDETRFFRVLICCGSNIDQSRKVYFEDKKAYENWSTHHRERCEKKGCFPTGGSWLVGW